jgi:hypothetical protein
MLVSLKLFDKIIQKALEIFKNEAINNTKVTWMAQVVTCGSLDSSKPSFNLKKMSILSVP